MKKTLSLLLVVLPFFVFSQEKNNDSTEKVIAEISSKLSAFSTEHAVEKAYLHFDKPYYALGDTIYFKAYLTIGPEHKLSALSGILYADLIGPGNKLVTSLKLPVISGAAIGDFTLADSLKAGNYTVRAYTQWMRNEGDGSFFRRTLTVGSTEAPRIPEGGKIFTAFPQKNKVDIQFLPEGGNLIAGAYSKIAFKAIGTDGLGAEVTGTVTDDQQNEVCTFASVHLGMGAFTFVPRAERSYQANVTYADGSTLVIPLPKADNNGYAINLNNGDADSIRLRITAGYNTKREKLILIARVGGKVYYAAEKYPNNMLFSVVIPKKIFPTGIVQFTLFSGKGEPLNERLAFIEHKDELTLNLKLPEKKFKTRQKMYVDLAALNKFSRPATGSFSVAVTNETVVPVDSLKENNILSDLLLTTELKGTVEQPDYYFENNTDKSWSDLDLLMLTQGYRHFRWKEILSDVTPALAYQPEKTLEISGTVLKHKKPVAGAKVTLFSNTAGAFIIDTTSDINGRFVFKNLIFSDSTRFIVQSKVPRGQYALTLQMDTILPPAVNIDAKKSVKQADAPGYFINQRQFFNEQKKYGINQHTVLLKEVIVRDKSYFLKRSKNLNGPGSGDLILTADDLKDVFGVTLSSALINKVAMFVGFRNGIPYSKIRPLVEGPMLVVVNGNPVDYDIFNNIDPESIQSMEIMVSSNFATMYAPRGASGVIEITTKRASDYTYERYAPGVVTYKPKGFYKAREFYSPQYDDPHTNTRMADLRSTIYWNPNVITDKDGKASFSYFNADGKGTYRVVVEGIDADGNIGRQVYHYRVK
ncbi:MAG TPA: hypothetical protein VHA56_01495 [Mucilaginibacter sp.]|nr:hypothetical protein [Mucilaginibacter sp.]